MPEKTPVETFKTDRKNRNRLLWVFCLLLWNLGILNLPVQPLRAQDLPDTQAEVLEKGPASAVAASPKPDENTPAKIPLEPKSEALSQAPVEPILAPEPLKGPVDVGTMVKEGFPSASSVGLGELPPPMSLMVEEVFDPLKPFRRKWFDRQRVLETSSMEVADNMLESFLETRLDIGVDNLIPFSEVLILESKEADRKKQKDRSFHLSKIALELSPEYPNAHFYFAYRVLKKDPLDFGTYIAEFLKGIYFHFLNPQYYLRHIANSAYYLSVSFIAALLFSLILILIKYFPLLAHTLHHMFFKKLPPNFSKGLVLLLLCLPLFLKFGIGWVILFFGLLFFSFADRGERPILVGLLLVVLLLPFGFPWFAGVFTSRSEMPFNYFLAMRNEVSQKDLKSMVIHQKNRGNEQGVLSFALGYIYKKGQNYQEAEKFYQKALEIKYFPAATMTNLGNVYFALGEPQKAIEQYQKAIDLNPNLFHAYYNMGRAYYEIKDVRRGTEALAKAKDLNGELTGYYEKIKSNNFNRLLIDVRIPSSEILKMIFTPSSLKEDLRLSYWNFIMRPLSIDKFAGVVVLFVILFGVTMLIRKIFTFPVNCIKCGAPACQWCYATTKHSDLCSQCLNAFIRREAVDPAAREAKEREISKFQRLQGQFVRFISILAPGSGHFFVGYTFRGFIFMFLFFLLVCPVLFWQGLFVGLVLPLKIFSGFKIIFLFGLGGLFYFYVVRDIFQE